MTRHRRWLRLGAAVLAVGLLAAACGDDGGSKNAGTGGTTAKADSTTTTSAQPKKGGTLTFGLYGWTSGLDPVVSNGAGTAGGIEMTAIYDTLMAYDYKTGKYVPRVAQSLESNADGSVWTMKLRPNVTFPDGTPLDAQAVVTSMKRHITYRSRSAALVGRVKDFGTPDASTVVFTLTSPWNGFPYVLSYSSGMITNPKATAACGDKAPKDCDFNLNPVNGGVGPFQIDSYKPSEVLTLKKNPKYWGGEPNLDGIKFVLYSRARTTLDAINRNEIQAGFLREAPVIKDAKDAKLEYVESLYWAGGVVLINNGYQITCNGQKPDPTCAGKADGTKVPTVTPTSDKRLRQAVQYAIDPTVYNERANEGKGYPSTQLFQKGSKWFNNVPGPTYNLDQAKKLVAEVKAEGKWDGSIRLSCHNGRPEWATVMETFLKAAGFTVKIKNDYDIQALIADVTVKHDFDLACWGINVADEAPSIALSLNLTSTSTSNWTGYSNPEFDAAISSLQTATDEAGQKKALETASKRIAEDIPLAIYDAVPETIVSGKTTHGIVGTVASMVFFDKAWIG